MDRPKHNDDRSAIALSARLDRWAREMNAFLMIFAVGLAVLYGTCLVTMKLSDAVLRDWPTYQLASAQQISATVP